MIKQFTASYIDSDACFDIYNISNSKIEGIMYALFCVVENLITRGYPTKASIFLEEQIKCKSTNHTLHFFTDNTPEWGDYIGGYDPDNKYPAKEFYYKVIPQAFKDYPFLQQLVVPEVLIGDIVDCKNYAFVKQRVDFYLPQAKLVIEIDGAQHSEFVQKDLDSMRDKFLADHDIETVRISAACIKGNTEELDKKIELIRTRINLVFEDINLYLQDYNDSITNPKMFEDYYRLTAIIRLQLTLLELCKNGTLDIAASKWSLATISEDISGYERIAITDLFTWLDQVIRLMGKKCKFPEVDLAKIDNESKTPDGFIPIRIGIRRKNTPVLIKNNSTIYVYSSQRQDVDFFELATAPPITYMLNDIESEAEQNESGLNTRRLALRFILKNLYGFDDFRPGQERIVINALMRRDTIGVLPTGSGKSICYQIPLLLQPCISFCVCPIKSLMIDQDQNLKDKGMNRTAYISSDLNAEQKTKTQERFGKRKYWWVYVSPERFQDQSFRDYLETLTTKEHIQFGYGVIDEVHCLSEWGHAFRVSYLNLVKTIKRYCGSIPMMGLTATASFTVMRNIMIEFGITEKSDVISIPSFTREELDFELIECFNNRTSALIQKLRNGEFDNLLDQISPEIKQKISDIIRGMTDNEIEDAIKNNLHSYHSAFEPYLAKSRWEELNNIVLGYLKFFPDLLNSKGIDSRCGIIFHPFVNGVNGCHRVALKLGKQYEKRIEFYAGEIPSKWDKSEEEWVSYKRNVQNDFKDNEFTLLTATKAYGMGIDKPNIRYTIHYMVPSSLESLYQEAGRAGRDKKKAKCTILFTRENEEYEKIIRGLLSPKESTSAACYEFTHKRENMKEGQDIYWQLFLLSNGLIPVNREMRILKRHILPAVKPDKVVEYSSVIYDQEMDSDDDIQKYIYHLSLVGVVDDWTVDWKRKKIKVYFKNYDNNSLIETTQRYIHHYNNDYDIRMDNNFLGYDKGDEETLNISCSETIERVLNAFLIWYEEDIIYSRKQALLTVMDSCEEYASIGPVEFKRRMEAYFQLDDVSDMLGSIADEPRNYKEWFTFLNPDKLKRERIRDIMMNLNRFLESYRNNVGLNYISGIVSIFNNSFDSTNGEDRLLMAMEKINTFDPEAKEYILKETAKLFLEMGNVEEKETFSEFMINRFQYDGTDRILYKLTEDNYSLLHFMIGSIKKIVERCGD